MRILLAVDGSEASEAAARLMAMRRWTEDSLLRILTVVHHFQPAVPEVALTLSYEQLAEPLQRQAAQLVARYVDLLRSTGLQLETKIRPGDPRVEIIDDATQWGADLIVVGSHGRTGLKRWLIGSVAEYVVRHAPCSVEVARLPRPR